MPRGERGGEIEIRGEGFHDRKTLVAQRGEGAGGAAELDAKDARAELVEALEMVEQRHQPDRAFQAEGGGQRVLEVGAAGHDGVAVAVGLGGEGVGGGAEFGLDEVEACRGLAGRWRCP